MKTYVNRVFLCLLALLVGTIFFAGGTLYADAPTTSTPMSASQGASSQGAPILVTTANDLIADDGFCSLREAIIAANTDSIFHDCPAGNGADTIRFDPALPRPIIITLTQTGADEESGFRGDLDISSTLTISGATTSAVAVASYVMDGNGTDRIFDLHSGATVTITGVTIRNGHVTNSAGGGLRVNSGARLTLTNSQISNNSALSGGGLQVLGRLTMNNGAVVNNQGGGIRNQGGLVTLNDVEISNNRGDYGIYNQSQGGLTFTSGAVLANQDGGIFNGDATATLTDLQIRQNSGGGVVNMGAGLTRLTITQSAIISNSATSGAGLRNEGVGASVGIYTTQVTGNVATSNGGALLNNGIMAIHESTIDHNRARAGAGIHHIGGNLSLQNDTISLNHATDNGGGLYNGSSAVLNGVTIVQNQAGGDGGNIFLDESALSIEHSIVALAQSGGNCVKSGGFLTSLGHNLESANSCSFSAVGDMTNADPFLGPLQANGGPTPTHALLADSPALDRGAASCLATDQRGIARPQGSACDIGAYEYTATATEPAADLAIAAAVAPVTITTGARLTYTVTIHNLGPESATALTLVDETPTGASLISATMAGVPCQMGLPLTCAAAQLAPEQILTATLVLTAPLSSGSITNTAVITAATADPLSNNNRVVTVRTVTPPPDLMPPSLVTNLTTTAITTQGATITWDAANDNVGVAGYTIYAQKGEPNTQRSVIVPQPFIVGQVDGMTTMYTVTGLLPNTHYQLWVVGYDDAGNRADLADAVPVFFVTLKLTVGITQISIEPPLPTDHDPISITVSGVYTTSCVPQYLSHERNGHQITITSTLSTDPFCLPAEFPWGYSLGLDPLPVGQYTVTHTLGQVVSQTHFTVTVAPMPTPPIFHVEGTQTYSAAPGGEFRLLIHASGAAPLTYALIEGPPGMQIDPTSGQLAWRAPTDGADAYTVTVRATNALGSADYTFTILIQTPRNDGSYLFLPLIVK
ncbi:MAG: choice-of-anchor Q domain-containing protein [Caldilineaceae bacterium]